MDAGDGIVGILLLALLPAIGSLIGVALAEWKQPSSTMTGVALHAAAGLAMAVVAIEFMPRAQERLDAWLIAIGIIAGMGFSLLLNRFTGFLSGALSGNAGTGSLWGIYGVVSIDLLSDGLMTGSGSAISSGLGLLLALSQVFGNLPGGFAVTAALRQNDVPRTRRLAMAAGYPAAPLLGAAAGFLALRDASPEVIGFVLALFAGLLLVATVEDMVPEADEPGAPRKYSSPAFAGGFVLLLLMSSYFGD